MFGRSTASESPANVRGWFKKKPCLPTAPCFPGPPVVQKTAPATRIRPLDSMRAKHSGDPARLRPTPFPDTTHARNYECKRHGTVTADLVAGHQRGRRPAPGVHRLSPSTGRQLPSRNQTSAGQARTETLACDLPVRVRVHAEARAESREVVFQQGGSHLAPRSGFEGRTRGTHGTNKQPVAFKWTCKDTPAGTLFWNFYIRRRPGARRGCVRTGSRLRRSRNRTRRRCAPRG